MLPPFWQYWHQIRDTVVLCGLGDLTRRCCPMSRSPPSWLGTMARFQTLLTLGTLRPCTAVLVPLFPSVLAWHWWMLTGRDSWEEITFQQQMRLIKSYFRAMRKENRLPLMFYFQKNESHIFLFFEMKLVPEVSLPSSRGSFSPWPQEAPGVKEQREAACSRDPGCSLPGETLIHPLSQVEPE